MFFAKHPGIPEYPKLIQSEQNDQHPSDPCKKHPVFTKEAAGSRCSQSQHKKRSADPQRKKEYAQKQTQSDT